MEAVKVDPQIEKDVLHLGHGAPLSSEAVAKALERHKKHHSDEKEAQLKANAGKQGKKGK